MAIKELKGCGVLRVDNDTILLDDSTNVISADISRLLSEKTTYVSVPQTFSTLSDAQLIVEALRNALITSGVMKAE